MPPPPPPPGSTPPPPPPPPNLTAPSSYTNYSDPAQLKRIGGIAKAATILVAIAGLSGLLTLLTARSLSDDAETFLAGGMDNTEFVEAAAPYFLMTSVQFVALIASAVLVIIWMFRVAANHRSLHRGGTWGPIWAVFGWVLPPFLYIIPFLMLREMYKASNPDTRPTGDWRDNKVSPSVTAWFLIYSVIPLGLMFGPGTNTLADISESERAMAKAVTGNQTSAMVGSLLTLAGAALFIMVIRDITRRHKLLTNEEGR